MAEFEETDEELLKKLRGLRPSSAASSTMLGTGWQDKGYAATPSGVTFNQPALPNAENADRVELPPESGEGGWHPPLVWPPKGKDKDVNLEADPKDLMKQLDDVYAEMAKVKYPERVKREQGVDLSADIDDLKQRLATLDEQQESAQKEIEKRQLYSEMAVQLGKFAAAMYGSKHGVDMAGLTPERPDFKPEYERLIDKYKTARGTEKDLAEMGMREKLRKGTLSEKEADAQDEYNRQKFAATEAGRQKGLSAKAARIMQEDRLRSMEEIAALRAEAAAKKNADKTSAKREADYSKLSQQINGLLKGKEPRDVKYEKIKAILQTNPLTKNVPKEEWENALHEPGWFGGKSNKAPEDALASITQKLSELAVGSNVSTAPGPAGSTGGSVTVVDKKTGKSYIYPSSDPRIEAARKDPRFEVR